MLRRLSVSRPLAMSTGVIILSMTAFPDFMKNPANRIARLSQATRGVEGYIFDGKYGSQMAFWICSENAGSAEQVHECDQYMLVVQVTSSSLTTMDSDKCRRGIFDSTWRDTRRRSDCRNANYPCLRRPSRRPRIEVR